MLLRIDDAELDTLDEGAGPAVVLLPGFPLSKESWDAQAARLAAHARVIRFDLRGLGGSSAPPGPYLVSQLAGDLAGVLDALKVERAVIVGHSMSTHIALGFYRMFSERAAGLGLIGGTASAETAASRKLLFALADRVEREGAGILVESHAPRYFAPEVYDGAPQLVERLNSVIRSANPAGAAAMLRGFADRDDSSDLFADIEVPVIVGRGARDALYSDAEARSMVDGIRGASLWTLDAGHMPLWEAPEATGDLIGSLLERSA